MQTTATHFVIHDWYYSKEGQQVFSSLVHKASNKRKVYGLLEKYSFPPNSMPDEYCYKIFVSGKFGVGKTSTIAKLTGNQIPSSHGETPGIQTSTVYWPARMSDLGQVIMFKLQFWEAGENTLKKFDHILPACKEKADAVMFLFSMTDKSSFQDIPSQMSRVLTPDDNMAKFIVGTKLDQHDSIDVTQRQLSEFEHQWRLPVIMTKNISRDPAGGSTLVDELTDVASSLNYICDQLWLRDQILAGKVPPPDFSSQPKVSFC